MATYRLVDSLMEVEAESPNALPASEYAVLYARSLTWRQNVGITEIRCNVDPNNPLRQKLRVEHQDGRIWKQDMIFSGPSDSNPIVEFNVNPGWALSEYDYVRDVRKELVRLITTHGLTNLTITFQ